MNYYSRLKFSAVILALFLPTIVLGQTSALFRDLVVGSVGEDVRVLQRWLNSHGYPITIYGPGAAGFETTYFGQLTQAALARYQVSIGVIPATGNLDLATRLKISGAGTTQNTGNLPAGCTSTIGFSPLSGIKCDQKTPQQQPILASTTKSTNKTVVTSLNLGNLGADLGGFSLPPEIPLSKTMGTISIFPTSGPSGTEVTITGYGFNKTKNKVYTGFGMVEAGSSDGKTLKVRVDPVGDVPVATASSLQSALNSFDTTLNHVDDSNAPSLPVRDGNSLRIYVVNETGRSNELIFKYQR